MIDDTSPEHHTRAPRAPIPLQHGPERAEQSLPNDVDFIDRQFEMWCVPIYKGKLVAAILAETSADPEQRPGHSPEAKRWEGHLADIVNDETLDGELVTGDPYELVFEAVNAHAAGDPKKVEALKTLARLYKYRESHMSTPQQYEKPLPVDLDKLLGLVLGDVAEN